MRFYFLILTACLPLWAQVTEEMTVIAREIRLHVIDKDGNPVRGLAADDLLVWEDGAQLPLTFFQEVDLTLPPTKAQAQAQTPDAPQTPGRTMVILLDTSNMTPDMVSGARDGVDGVIAKLGPRDRVKLVQLEERLFDLTPFTGDKERLRQGLQKTAFRGVQRRELSQTAKAISDHIITLQNMPPEFDPDPVLRMIDEETKQKERRKAQYYKTFLNGMGVMAQTLGMMDGTRSILLVSGGNFLETNGAHTNTEVLGHALNEMLNRNNVTVYSFLAATRTDRSSTELQMQRVVMNQQALQNFGLIYGDLRKSQNTILDRPGKEGDGLDLAARGTGGFMARGSDSTVMSELVGEVFDRASHFYRLTYMVASVGKSSKVRVKLKQKMPGVELVYGRDVAPKQPYLKMDEASQEMTQRAMLLYSHETVQGLDADWRYHLNRGATGGFVVTVFGQTAALSEAGYEIGFSAFDAQGLALDLITSKVTSLPERKNFSFSDVLITERAPAVIRCYLRDLNTGHYNLQPLAVPERRREASHPLIPQLVFGTAKNHDVLPLNHLRQQSKGAQARVAVDPLVVNNALFRTGFSAGFVQPKKVAVLFQVENLPQTMQDNLKVDFILKSSAGTRAVSGRIVSMMPHENAVAVMAEVQTEQLERGDYSLWVRVTKPGMTGEVIRGGRFRVSDASDLDGSHH